MTKEKLIEEIKRKKSFLCVGLDPDLSRIPKHLLEYDDPIYEFNKVIIDATKDYAVAYKPNLAFYECLGTQGWETLKKTEAYIPDNCFKIADAKRGDIGNTSKYYAKAFFEDMNFDSVTIAPYMGADSVKPFFEYENKWVILLALTSNAGALDFQFSTDTKGEKLFEKVLRKSSEWGGEDRLMYVVGATRSEAIADVRSKVPNHFFLVPGVGAQGGTVAEVAKYGWNRDCGLLINSSRGIIYADDSENFGAAAAEKAKELQVQMAKILEEKEL
ncbi:MAG: orotidine-5'-phosphate decarboxylase [Crocinitomicaceae bacterium]|nr:orotidine-5'-phosphate decarboxylase [Crocinitomicaceae bacterium]